MRKIILTLSLIAVMIGIAWAADLTYDLGTTPYGQWQNLSNDFVYYFPFTMPQGGVIDTIAVRGDNNSGTSAQTDTITYGLYSDASHAPGTLLGATGTVIVTNTTQLWRAALAAPYTATGGTVYWIAITGRLNTTTNSFRFDNDNAVTDSVYYSNSDPLPLETTPPSLIKYGGGGYMPVARIYYHLAGGAPASATIIRGSVIRGSVIR